MTIEIKPRWGAAILDYLLQYTTGIYMPRNAAAGVSIADRSAEWLLVLLWKSMFNQALRRYHIPKEYRIVRTNDRFFKGRLDVQKQIRENIADQSKFCCVHAPLTMNTTINQTIRCVVKLLSRKQNFAALMSDIGSYDERLASLRVEQRDVAPAEIDRIRYTKMSIGYEPLMRTSKAIIRHFGAGQAEKLQAGCSFLVDIAEIWENYLQAILTRHLPEYSIESPNELGGEPLIAKSMREIRPDLLIKKHGKILAILDAKYKALTSIGTTERQGVSREDLYQMTTYLYHYGKPGTPLLGLFVSPFRGEDTLHGMSSRPEHRIGVLSFGLSEWDETKENRGKPVEIAAIQEKEREFAKRVRELLEKPSSLTR